MKTSDSVLSSEAQRSEQASERAALAKFNGRATDVEIEHLRKLARDMRNGLIHLATLKAEPYDIMKRRANLGARLTAVEGKIFRLQQGRLI